MEVQLNNSVLRHRRNPFENSRMLKGRQAKMPDYAALRYPQDARNLRLKETTIGWIRSLPRPVRPRADQAVSPDRQYPGRRLEQTGRIRSPAAQLHAR